MENATFLEMCIQISMAFLVISFVFCVFRIVRGPSLPDRILALDLLVALSIGFIAVIGVKTQFYLYLDIAISLGLIGFLATVAFARFVLTRDSNDIPETRSESDSLTIQEDSGT